MKLISLLSFICILFLNANLFALPGQVTKPIWNIETDVVSWTAVSGALDYSAQLYKNGSAFGAEVTGIASLTYDFHATLLADGTPSSNNNKYTVKVRARDNSGYGAYSVLSLNNVKGLSSIIVKGLNGDDNNDGYPIWNTGNLHTAFSFSPATLTYTATLRHELRGLFIYFPNHSVANTNNPVEITNTFNLSTVVLSTRTLSDSAYTDLEMARHASTDEKNVITIVVNKNNTGFERTYTLNFRRRMGCAVGSMAQLLPASTASPLYSITGNTQYSSALTGSNVSFTPGTDTPSLVNGDTTPTYTALNWYVQAETGTAYFDTNGLLHPLSNGTFKVRAKTTDGTNLNRVSKYSYNITGMSGWPAHLGKLVICDANILTDTLTINPAFKADLPNSTIFSVTVAAGTSSICVSSMVPTDCSFSINNDLVANNSDVVIKLKKGINTLNLRVIKNSGTARYYTLVVTREANARLQYGIQTVSNSYPYLSAPNGTQFGLDTATHKDRMTVEAWVKWSVTPPSDAIYQWANIVTIDRAYQSDIGQFWLQHDVTNTKFEFALRTTTGRNFVQSRTQPLKDTWYHIAGVYTGSYIKLFVNGVEEASASRTGDINPITNVAPNPDRLWIGRSPSTGTNNPGTRIFVGNIRGVALWMGQYKDTGQIADDYMDGVTNETNVPDEAPLPNFFWLLNETSGSSGTSVLPTFGAVNLTMQSLTNAAFTNGGSLNDNNGSIFLYRPIRMDLRNVDTSQSAILVDAGGYDSNAKYILPSSLTSPTYYKVWNHITGTYQQPTSIDASNGVPFYHNPSTTAGRFWIPIIPGGNSTVDATFVDALTANYAAYHTQIPCSTPTAMIAGNTFDITGYIIGNTRYPTTNKYVVLGYNQTVDGNLISATSTDIATNRAQFKLASDQVIKRIEIRTLDDIPIKNIMNSSGWSTNITLDDQTLPVELTSFTAVITAQNYVTLDWTTQSETGVLGYRVYRNTSGNFDSATMVSPLIEATNTSQTTTYSFTDNEITEDGTYYYWLQNQDIDGEFAVHGPISVIVQISTPPDIQPVIPILTKLNNPYPNPFNPDITIAYDLAKAEHVQIMVFNMKGQKICTLLDTDKDAGQARITWNGKNDNGNSLASGIYYVHMTAGKYQATQKVVLLK